MAQAQLGEDVRRARTAAGELVAQPPASPFRPPPAPATSLGTTVATAQTAARGVVDEGRTARAQAGSARNEQRRAEDRQLIIDTAAAAGVQLSAEAAERIRGTAWRAADRSAQSDATRGAARTAGEASSSRGMEDLRDAMSRVIGNAAEEAAYGVVRQELQALGLSGEALDSAARTIARQAGRREMTDASAWTRTTAREIAGSGSGGGAAASPAATAAPAAADQQEAAPPQEQQPQEQVEMPEEEERQQARALVFQFRADADSLTRITQIVNNDLAAIVSPDATPEVQRLANWDGALDRYGFRGENPGISIRIDLDALRAAGHVIDEEAVARDLAINPAQVLNYFMRLGMPQAVRITQTGGAAGGLRPPGTELSIEEFSAFANMLSTGRSFAAARAAGERIALPARLSGRAES